MLIILIKSQSLPFSPFINSAKSVSKRSSVSDKFFPSITLKIKLCISIFGGNDLFFHKIIPFKSYFLLAKSCISCFTDIQSSVLPFSCTVCYFLCFWFHFVYTVSIYTHSVHIMHLFFISFSLSLDKGRGPQICALCFTIVAIPNI